MTFSIQNIISSLFIDDVIFIFLNSIIQFQLRLICFDFVFILYFLLKKNFVRHKNVFLGKMRVFLCNNKNPA